MKTNMGFTDRFIRILFALVVAVLYINGSITGVLGLVLLLVGIIFFLTSMVSTCLIYLPFGIKTNKNQS
ncbi:MAG: DUF2892 domain-containing protein [Bacteroidia bacterium]